jgi:hypothetical protein
VLASRLVPVFVHLAPEPVVARILRNGIRRSRTRAPLPSGVFAMPVGRCFYASHQWLRELKRSGQRTLVAVYFRIGADQPVWFGHFGQGHVLMPASQAAGHLANATSPEGFQVLIPRRIEPGEIMRTRPLRQVIGWRYFPGSHGRPPCGCPACLARGEIKSRAIRDRYESGSA